ncbi:MAG: hypothetical protein FWE40_02875 [Oscillospiraceae bacterium]|nr:hypothetical protein [Oscillospiraceae bacterium]
MAQQKKTPQKKDTNSVTLSRKKIVIIAVALAVVLALLISGVVYLLVAQGLPFNNRNDTPQNGTQEIIPPPPLLGENDFDPFAGVDFDHYITLGDWRGVVVDFEAFDDEQMSLMVRAQFAEETDRTVVQRGDYTILGFDVYVEGVGEVPEMSTEEFELVIGSGFMMDGFEEQLVGQVIGQTVEIRVTFPEAQENEEDEFGVAGRNAVFTTVVHEIFAPPAELTEEQVWMVSEGATTDKQEFLNMMFNQIRSLAAVQAFHVVIDDHVEFIGNLPAAANIYQDLGPQGESWAREDLVVFAIAAQEGITITQADVDAELDDFRQMEGEESIEEMFAQVRQMHGNDLTEEEMLLVILNTDRERFVRGLMFARIGELIFTYAVDAEGNSVFVEARE